MIINTQETKETRTPIAWVYQNSEPSSRKFLVISDGVNIVALSTMGLGPKPNERMYNPYGEYVLKRFYQGDEVTFTIEEGEWV